ncbi:hypothetical protein PhCBS80983_g03919 [Powellomyces hirtus]|uniref:Obg family GTPase CgtA n=1 Tax=Powellomyces hirtus TaxID=109895 RepID=A0A507E1U1_9FUNG|nr:hypothetical protein PhCBS80983_g03919 [Powellomyces hirtus]
MPPPSFLTLRFLRTALTHSHACPFNPRHTSVTVSRHQWNGTPQQQKTRYSSGVGGAGGKVDREIGEVVKDDKEPEHEQEVEAVRESQREETSDQAAQRAALPSVHRKFLGKSQPFVDYKRVRITAGKGGDGAITFFRSARNPFGPPSGGNGARGGSCYIVASKDITSLNGVQNRYAAHDGGNGFGKQMHGADGQDVEVVVPVGTLVKFVDPPVTAAGAAGGAAENDEEMEFEDEEEEASYHQMQLISKHYKFKSGYTPQPDRIAMLLERLPYEPASSSSTTGTQIDLTKHGQRLLVARGGRGGAGNPHFQSAEIRGPAIAGRGQPGTTTWVELELKTIADAGLVGLPNAGKSTFLAAVSNAHPKCAPYPFTTLNPYVGTIDFPDFWTMTLADIPGLVAGAHVNVGLGHRFLRHVERNRVLVYVLDVAKPEPWEDLATLRNELEKYKKGLTDKPSLIVANKADAGPAAQEHFEELKKRANGIPVVPVSALKKKNITKATGMLREIVEKLRREEPAEEVD